MSQTEIKKLAKNATESTLRVFCIVVVVLWVALTSIGCWLLAA